MEVVKGVLIVSSCGSGVSISRLREWFQVDEVVILEVLVNFFLVLRMKMAGKMEFGSWFDFFPLLSFILLIRGLP